MNFLRRLALQEKIWWDFASRCFWNRARHLTFFLSASVTRKDLQFGTWTDPLFPMTLSIPSYDIGKYVGLRTYQFPFVLESNCKYDTPSNIIKSNNINFLQWFNTRCISDIWMYVFHPHCDKRQWFPSETLSFFSWILTNHRIAAIHQQRKSEWYKTHGYLK